MGGEPTEQELITALEAEFDGWQVFKGVGDVGWYMRRPRSSPPRVAGPAPLGSLREHVLAEIAEREEQHRQWEQRQHH